MRRSVDGGHTWSAPHKINADLAVGPDGTIYCLYEGGGVEGNAFDSAYLTLTRFNLEWLTDGTDSFLRQ